MKKNIKRTIFFAVTVFVLSFFIEALVNFSIYASFSWLRAFSVAFSVAFVVGLYEYFVLNK